MKKILLATDFSESATKARDYAIELAERTNAEVIILHSYSVEELGSENLYQEMYEHKRIEVKQQLDLLDLEFQSRRYADGSGPLRTKLASTFTDPLHEISEIINHEEIDLIILGNIGEEDAIEFDRSDLLKKLIKVENIPVLSVPTIAPGVLFKKVVLGVELVPEDEEAIRQLLDLFKGIPLDITVLHLYDSHHHPEETVKFKLLEQKFKDVEGLDFKSLRYPDLDDPEYGLSRYVNENKLDLLVLVKHQRNFLEGLFHKSAIQELVAYSHIPVLIVR